MKEPVSEVTTEEVAQEEPIEEPVSAKVIEGEPSAIGQANTAMPVGESVKSSMKMPTMADLAKEIKEEAKPKVVTEEGETEESFEGKPAESVTMFDLQKHWSDYAQKMSEAGRVNHQMILQDRELQLEGNTIKIKLDNAVQEEHLVTLKEELMTYLRENLNNYRLMIEAEIAEVQDTKMLYTAQEKYNHLSEKHPDIKKLKDMFGLETDY